MGCWFWEGKGTGSGGAWSHAEEGGQMARRKADSHHHTARSRGGPLAGWAVWTKLGLQH
jgi:hypothetical protein